MMLLGNRSPNKILFAKKSGLVWQTDFCPVYDHRYTFHYTFVVESLLADTPFFAFDTAPVTSLLLAESCI